MHAPVKSQQTWAEELAREVASLPVKDFLLFLTELSTRLIDRSCSGPEIEREIMAALAEHFGDAEEAAHLSMLIERR
jgi:hypothetical protein